jgi:hypothetical protein
MPLPPKPSTFEPEWLDLLMYLAYTAPQVTSNWQHFCKGLVLQEYSLTNQKTPNGKTSYSIIRLIAQLPPCLINETTKDEQNGIQAKLVNIGSTSKKNRTGVLVTCPFSAEGVLKDLPAVQKRNAQVWGMNGLLDEETTARLRGVVHDESTKSFRILYILPECDDKFEHCNEDFNFFYNPSTKELEIPPLPNQLLPLIKAFDMKSGQGRGYVSFTIPLKGSEICLVKKEVRKPVAASIYSNLSDDDEV